MAESGALVEDENGAPLPDGLQRVIRERLRQINVEGYDEAHDIGHERELVEAAACYTVAALSRWHPISGMECPPTWPWAAEYWKPSHNSARNIEKAAALLAAALDQMPEGGIESTGGWGGL